MRRAVLKTTPTVNCVASNLLLY